jgi:dihydroorotase
MQNYLLKQVIVTDRQSAHHGQTVDIAIENGTITSIEPSIESLQNGKVLQFSECYITQGFVDTRCNSSDPGLEHRETFNSLSKAALAGGFCRVALLPNTKPVRQSKSDIEFVNNQNMQMPVEFLPLGAITQQLKENDMAEMYDMQLSGAVAFSNANHSIQDAGTQSRAMQYTKSFNGLIYSFCHDESLASSGQVAEGPIAVSLGLKGIPAMAEYLMVQREIELADYHQCRIHISKVSTEKSVELIRQAKSQGTKITADVAVMNLVLTDETLMDFDTNLKLLPPLRQANDVKALWQGLTDGTIDSICTDHHPQEIENKSVEFDYASYGAISIQIAMSLAIEGRNRFCPSLPDEQLFEKLNINPCRLLSLESHPIQVGEKACFTIINPHKQTILGKQNNQSLSSNTYYLEKPLPYFVEATFNGKYQHFNNG